MEMHQIRYFLAVHETLNFTRAAEQCHVSQPALTRAIQKLEEELGGPLFRRERKLTHLTDLGRLMEPYLRQTHDSAIAARALAENFRTLDNAPLRLGMMCTIGPGRLVNFFSRIRGEIPNLEISMVESAGHVLIDNMMEGEIDLALIGLPAFPERLDAIPLYSENYVVAFSAGHRFEAMDVVPVAELNGEDYLSRSNCEFPDYFSVSGDLAELNVNTVYESEREDWIQGLVVAGMGCSVMPEYLPTMPGILIRPLVCPELSRQISLVTVSGRQFSPTVQAFVKSCTGFEW